MNPNWQGQELDYETMLELPTKYRFAEIEISRAIPYLAKLEEKRSYSQYSRVASRIYRRIQLLNLSEQREAEFIEATQTPNFRQPSKKEIGIYLRYKNLSYKGIREITSMSPNTIAKLQFEAPFFTPVYQMWDQDMLAEWNDIKGGLNIWNEKLHHMK